MWNYLQDGVSVCGFKQLAQCRKSKGEEIAGFVLIVRQIADNYIHQRLCLQQYTCVVYAIFQTW